MGVFEGLLGGFLNRKYDVEAENRRQSELASAHEQSIFKTLLESPDPETQHLAIAGLLDSANPRRKAKGLRGWIGETQASPYLAQIQALSPTVRTEEEVQGQTLPSRQMRAGATLPDVQPSILPSEDRSYEMGDPASAGMPPNSPVEPGAPPPTPVSYTQSPPTPATFTRIAYRPRQVLMDPEQKAFAKAIAEARAEPAGMYAGLKAAGFTDEQSRDIVKSNLSRRYGSGSGIAEQSISGEVPDGKGGWVPAFGVFNKIKGTYEHPGTDIAMVGFRPRTTTASTSLGTSIEPLARAMFGKRGADLSQPEMAQVMEAGKLQKNALTVKDAIASAQRFLPNATVDRQMALADALMSGTQAPVTAAAGGPPSPTVPPTATPDTAAPTAAPPATGGPPAGGPPKLSTIVPPDLGAGNRESGKPLPPAVTQSLARAKASNDLIDQALAALEPYKDDNDPKTTLRLAKDYRQGVFDPDAGVAMQLSDLAGLQQSASTQLVAGGSRAIKTYLDRRQHVPRLPSTRQVEFYSYGAPAGAIGSVSRLLKSDEGGWDSPKLMYEKLKGAQQNNLNFIHEMESEVLQTKPMPNQGGSATAGRKTFDTAQPGEPYFDPNPPPNGTWRVKQ